jgi:hypothetical protein
MDAMNTRAMRVLSDREWLILSDPDAVENVAVGSDVIGYLLDGVAHVAVHEENAVGRIDHPTKLIAIANAALDDTDPLKITRHRIEAMRYGGRALIQAMLREYGPRDTWGDVPLSYEKYGDSMIEFSDALESYLPPV